MVEPPSDQAPQSPMAANRAVPPAMKWLQTSVWVVIRAIASGLIISIMAGSTVFMELAKLNARFRPELPWAACVNLVWLALAAVWLNGWGWPRSTSLFRH